MKLLLRFHPLFHAITVFIVCHMHVGEILATKTKEDAEKRKQLHELKAEMEHEMKVIFSPVYNLPYTGLCSLTYLDYS